MVGVSELLVLLAAFVWILLFLKLQWDRWSLPPGPIPFPFIGSLWHYPSPFEKYFSKLGETYGKVSTIWLGHFPIVVLNGFQALKDGLITHSEEFSARAQAPLFEDVIKNRGIIFSNGHTSKQQRRFALATLRKLGVGKKIIESQVQEQTSELVEFFTLQKGKPLDPWEHLLYSVSSMISAVVLGHDFPFGDKKFHEMFHGLDTGIEFIASPFNIVYFIVPKWIRRLVGPPRKPVNAYRTLVAFAREEIRNHEQNRRSEDPQDFIDFYLKQMEESKDDPTATYNEGNLAMSMLELFGAGIDTTSIALYWALLYMAAFPQVQAAVQKELDNVVGPSQDICYDDRKRLPYTHAVIHEILRFSSIFTCTFRQCTKDTVVQGALIKKGTIIIPILTTSLFDPEQWETPHQFNPNHFLDEDCNFVSKEAFVPFSAGPRACVGEQMARMQIFIVFSRLLQSFTFRAPDGAKEMNLKRESKGFFMRPRPYTICAISRSAAGKEGHW